MAADMPATEINDIAQIQSRNGLEAACLFRALSGDYVSPHPSPPTSPRAAPDELPTAMSAAPASQPSRRRGPVIVKSHQPTQLEMEAMGMKVRDYGYNNPLPPLKAWRPPQRQPTPPGRKGLQREDTEPMISDSSQESQPWGGLQRKTTEPVFAEPSQTSSWPTPVAGPSRPPLVQTPIVTPNGSTRWSNGCPPLSRQGSHRAPPLSLRFDFPPAQVEHSPATPTSPVNQPPRRSRRLIRDSPTIAAAGGRPTRSRRKTTDTQVEHRYPLRSKASPPEHERKKGLRSRKPTRGVAVSAEARCPTPKRPRSETQAAQPYYPSGKSGRRRRS